MAEVNLIRETICGIFHFIRVARTFLSRQQRKRRNQPYMPDLWLAMELF